MPLNPRHEFATVSVALDEYEIIDKKISFGYALSEAEELTQKERKKMSPDVFLFPKTRSFPLNSPDHVLRAIHAFGRGKNGLTYSEFIHKLYNKCKSLGPEYVSKIPKATLEKCGIDHKDDKK